MAGLVANPNNLNITGARVTFVLNGQVMAYARSVSLSYSIDYQENRVLNNLRAESHSPVSYRYTLSCSLFRIPKQTTTSLGFFPQTGNTPSDQLVNVLTIPELTAVITDVVTGTALYTCIGVRIASNSIAFDAGGSVVGTEVDCVVRAIVEESEIAPAA